MANVVSFSERDVGRKILIRGLSHDYKRVLSSLNERLNEVLESSGDASSDRPALLIDIAKKNINAIRANLDEIADEIDSSKNSTSGAIISKHRTKLIRLLSNFEETVDHLNSATFSNRSAIAGLIEHTSRAKRQMVSLIDLPFRHGQDVSRVDTRAEVSRIISDLHGLVAMTEDKVVTIRNKATHSISTDRLLLGVCISNLVTNAIIHGGKQELEITVSSFESGLDPSLVCMAVEDNGVGITVGDERKIFKLFERGSNVSHSPGTGVGLAFSRIAAEMMGGSLTLDTAFRTGARFVLSIPHV